MSNTISPSSDIRAQGTPRSVQPRQLIIGIKRHLANYAQSALETAQQVFLTIREPHLEQLRYKCQYCGFKSAGNDLTHLDGNHHNHDAANLMASCNLCHSYHHVGQELQERDVNHTPQAQTGIDKHVVLIRAPGDPRLSAPHFNHLLRAIAIALRDEKEAPEAIKVLTALVQLEVRQDMREALVSTRPSDIALALSKLTDDEYRQSRHLLRDVRMIYSPDTLRRWGQAWAQEQPEIADPAQWSAKLSAIMEHIEPDKEGVGVEALDAEADDASLQYQHDLDLDSNTDDDQ